MSLSLGDKLRIRAMIYVAGEPVPFFWPMRSFIHHNPLHGLEHMQFADAVALGSELFHGRAFLDRSEYQRYLESGDVDRNRLEALVAEFAQGQAEVPGVDLKSCLIESLYNQSQPAVSHLSVAGIEDVAAALRGEKDIARTEVSDEKLSEILSKALLNESPVYESVDALFGTDLGEDLDDLVVKSCMDFFDEGQSVWGMPKRNLGFFNAWREVASRNVRLSLRGINIKHIFAIDDTPEGVIAHVLETLGVPESDWVGYFTKEIARLHGWAGFIRWRSNAKHYYWTKRFPADLVDFVAIRMALGLALLQESGRHNALSTREAIQQAIMEKPREIYLRHELHSGKVLPALAHEVEMAIETRSQSRINKVFSRYIKAKQQVEAHKQAENFRSLAALASCTESLEKLNDAQLAQMLESLLAFEKQEGMVWLKSMESKAMATLLDGISIEPEAPREKRPFVQAMFCIDTRSERIRRHLEAVGDYQTFGIAGFFGVPVSFMELGKGSENHLCPVILTPKNLVLEMTASGIQKDQAAVTTLEKAMHDLKESVLTPFVTVEAIGLLFGFDMVGKTVAPKTYNRWRKQVHPHKDTTRLLLDKLSREQADSIIRTVQRAVVLKSVENDLGLATETINDDLIRDFRECAMGDESLLASIAEKTGLHQEAVSDFIQRLQKVYRIDPAFTDMQLEQLGRIGYTIDEQANYVSQALHAVGMTKEFSRFILLVGHGSESDNNPYESALDCGACGGNHGIVNARVIAQMGNKPKVRKRLREMGVAIPEDAWFIPALHNTTTDEIKLHDLDLIPPSHLLYLDRLRSGLNTATMMCAQERVPTLQQDKSLLEPKVAYEIAQRNSMDWSQVRPEWGLSRNAYFIIGRRAITQQLTLEGRAFLHSYDYKIDPLKRVLENILTGPLVVGQWINMEHYFSAVDNERFGSSSKAYHNVVGRFGVMTGNLSDLRTGLPSQTVLEDGLPYHQPIRLITVIEAPFDHAVFAIEAVVAVKNLVRNGWIRMVIVDPETQMIHTYDEGEWHKKPHENRTDTQTYEESAIS